MKGFNLWGLLTVLAFAVAVGIGVWGMSRGSDGEELAELRGRIESLENDRAPVSTPLLRRLMSLEARFAKFEAQWVSGVTMPWGQDDVEMLRVMLEEVKRRDRADITRGHVKQRLEGNGFEMSAEEEDAIITIVSRYTGSLLAVRENPAGIGPGLRYAGARQAHARMVQEVRALLPPARADALIALYPPPEAPRGPDDGK